MKFPKKIKVCRQELGDWHSMIEKDNIDRKTCENYNEGKCMQDNYKCKVVIYIKEK